MTSRTGLGQLADGRVILVAADGRLPGYSVGMTNFELAQALVRLGAVTGMALDGGGSTTMAFDGSLLNRPSGAERPISTAVLLQYTGVFVQPAVAVVSPDGDGVGDRQTLRYKVVRPSTVNVTLEAPNGAVAYSEAVTREPGSYAVPFPPPPPPPVVAPALASTATAGRIAAEPPIQGKWKLTVSATDDVGQPSEMSQTFLVNSTVGFLVSNPKKLFLPPGGHDLRIAWRQTKEARVVVTVETPARVRSCAPSRRAATRPVPQGVTGTASTARRRRSRAASTFSGSWPRTRSGRSSSRRDLRVQRIVGPKR